MKPIAVFYDYVYYELADTFYRKKERLDKITSTASTLAMVEAWYWFDFLVLRDQAQGAATPILSLRLSLIIVFLVLTLANVVYFLGRHDNICKSVEAEDERSSMADFAVLSFFVAPIILFCVLLWLRHQG